MVGVYLRVQGRFAKRSVLLGRDLVASRTNRINFFPVTAGPGVLGLLHFLGKS